MKNKKYIEVTKIWATGSYKTYVYFKVNEKQYCFYTSNRDLYYELKNIGVPTSQSLRKR